MKKLTTILILFLVTSASADLKWVRGPFWKTVYENRFSLNLVNINSEITEECSYFESLVQDSNGKPTGIDKETFTTIDSMTLPSDMLNQTFQLDFKVSIPANLTITTEMQNRIDVKTLVNNEALLDILQIGRAHV